MANINITLDHPLKDGETITFKAPCDCTAVKGMVIQYPNDDGSATSSKNFTFKDSHNNDLTGIGNLFSAGAVVVVAVSMDDSAVQILNAATNGYLESKSVGVETKTVSFSGANSGSVYQQRIGDLVHVVGGVSFNITTTTSTLTVSTSGLPVANSAIPHGFGVTTDSHFNTSNNTTSIEYAYFSVNVMSTSGSITFKKIGSTSFGVGYHSINFDFWYTAA